MASVKERALIMSDYGFIKLFRKMTEWEWYTDEHTFRVFMHLLLTANYKETNYKGVTIYPGQTVIGRKALANALHISERNVRTALKHLKSTNEIAIKATNKFSVITIVNWELYQCALEEVTSEATNKPSVKRPASDQQVTTPKEYKKEKNSLNTINSISGTRVPQGTVRQKVIDEWNDLPLPNIRDIKNGTNRYSMLSARVKEYGIDSVIEAIRSIRDSNFLLGQNSKGWAITFDWFVRPNNFAKVLEGNYTDKLPNGEKSEFTMTDEEFNRIVQEHSGADTW